MMMFLQYAIWGSWGPVLSAYLLKIGFSSMQTGIIYSLLPLATIISPFAGGQLADRYFSTQKVISFLQLTGGILLVITSRTTDYTAMMWLMLLYCLLYAPTLALTNSISLINLENSEKDFSTVRVWGAIGWICAGLSLSGWRILSQHYDSSPCMVSVMYSFSPQHLFMLTSSHRKISGHRRKVSSHSLSSGSEIIWEAFLPAG